MATGVELATGYVTVTTETSRVPGELGRAFGQAGNQAGQQGGQAAAGGILDSLKGKAGMFGEVLGAAFAVAGVSAAGLFVKALQNGMEREKTLDMTQARLGVDDATMQRIGTAAARAYAGAFGASVEENVDTARRAMQSGLLDPNATAQQTQQVIAQLSGISELMGEEIPAVSRAAGQAIRTGMAMNATEAMDLFAAAEKNGLNVSEDFLDTISEYSTQFRKLGLSGPEAIGLINQSFKGGARDVDVAADAIKEFSIRVVDGSKATTEAFQTLGFDAEDLTARFAAGGATARAATGDLLAEIRKIEDPVKRNEIALALFGTQFEDLGGALNAMNLDTAVESLGKVAGAAQDALHTMDSNASTSIESAKRSIQISADAISSALAQAFGPQLAKLADWVTKHQPEVLGFLGRVVDFAFGAGDAFLAFSSTSLRALASFAEGAGGTLARVLEPLGKVTEIFGRLTHNDDLENLGKSVQGLDDKFRGVADGARALADGIDNTARPGLDRMRKTVTDQIETTQRAQVVFRALGDTVTALPSGHDIVLRDNTPETTARLEALGLKVATLPGGEVRVTANTVEGQALLDGFIARNSGKVIPVEIAASLSAESRRIAEAAANSGRQTYSPGYVRYAAGGLFRGAGGPRDDANVVRLSDREFIVNAAATARNLPLLDAINAGWTPSPESLRAMVGDIPGFSAGGLASERAVSYARAHNGAPYEYGKLDCSGFLSGIYNQLTGRSARFTSDADLAAYGFVPGYDPNGFSVGTNGGSGTAGHMAGTLLGVPVESDATNGIQYGGSADGANSLPSVWNLPRDIWSPPETDNPTTKTTPGQGSGAGGATPGASPGSATGLGSSASSVGTGTGATFDAAQIPAGVTPVWIVGSSTNLTPTPSEALAPQAVTQTAAADQPAVAPNVAAITNQAAGNFLQANFDQLLGDVKVRKSGGAIQALVDQVFQAMQKAMAEEMRRRATQSNTFARR
ncbi:phage tail tape measure protein [Nocardia sp. NPDC052566]|uniref:phage tail tape measure protein n=1 Tax=Nocardia sp. NPDC052566 TaxID=3364330 RepID=UPI0037C97ED7